MGAIAYIKGDATCPQARGTKLICHVCNDRGKWGKGFVLALSRRWEEPEAACRSLTGRAALIFGTRAPRFGLAPGLRFGRWLLGVSGKLPTGDSHLSC